MSVKSKKILASILLLLLCITIAVFIEEQYSKIKNKNIEAINTSPQNIVTKTSENIGVVIDTIETQTNTSTISDTTPIKTATKELNEPINTSRITYVDGFYCEELNADIKKRINGKSYKEDCTTPYEDLRYLNVKYIDFDSSEQIGEIICNKEIAMDLLEIFYELYIAKYPIEKIKLVDEYNADDNYSMENNNTSCFNYRKIPQKAKLSKHALGMAIDINPLYNPYVVGTGDTIKIYPENAAQYVDRAADFQYKIDTNDLCYKLFAERGFTWGGTWKNKDYQHFEK